MNRKRMRRARRQTLLPEITLTPLIDTALTLLIIFMVTTPMIQNAIKVDLPKGQAQEGGSDQQELIVLVDQKGGIFFNNQSITLDNLGQTIKNHLTNQKIKEKSVWLKIDASNSCDTLVGVIDRIKVIGGVKDVKIITQKPAVKAA